MCSAAYSPVGEWIASKGNWYEEKHDDPKLVIDVIFINIEKKYTLTHEEYLLREKERGDEWEGEREGKKIQWNLSNQDTIGSD